MPRTRAPRAAVGGLIAALILAGLAAVVVVRPWAGPGCAPASNPDWSVARRWDEAMLDAIRRALPAPTVHARNLYHTSAAMWDVWAAYDPVAAGVFVNEKVTSWDLDAARNEAISYAAYRVLSARYLNAVGGDESLSEFADVMDTLCYPVSVTTTAGNSPASVGNRVAQAILDATRNDGSNEADGYAAADYAPVNPPLVVAGTDISITDPDRWQPLQLEHMISQNGIPVTNGVQAAIGPHWGHVAPFAIPGGGLVGVPMDPGPPPAFGSQEYRDQAVEVIRLSSELDPTGAPTIDISPGAIGNNPLGTNDGAGYVVNPVTGEPYQTELVNRADFGRVMAEFWADGPRSETPPGHWNVLANKVGDELGNDLRIGGAGPVVDRLEWDVKTYLALNGAVHDAAIAAWGLKGHYDSIRPISMIRYMGSLGQSTDPRAPSYDADGLPLVPDLIELITDETTTAGGRHAALAGHEGEIAIRAWAGNPADPETELSRAEWMLATEWVPYQLPTFVTPSFPGYVSGHSTFSRAAAEVMTAMTGSPYFPGGVSGYTIPAGSLDFELGPTTDVELEWATYYDAADQAGRSRLWGGIHISADDFSGRRIGSECGKAAWERAKSYFSGAIAG
jgi:hypothetical protein